MTLTVRPMTAADIPPLAQMLNQIIAIGGTTAYEAPFTHKSFADEFLTGEWIANAITAEHSVHGPIGMQILLYNDIGDPTTLAIASFANQELRVPGVGREMIARTKADAKALGCKTIHAKIRADNTPGLKYYTGQGFVRFGVDEAVPLKDGTPVDRVLTRLVLD